MLYHHREEVMWCECNPGEVVHMFYMSMTSGYGRKSGSATNMILRNIAKEGIFPLVFLTHAPGKSGQM